MELDLCWIYVPFYCTFSGSDVSLIGVGAELKFSTTMSWKNEL